MTCSVHAMAKPPPGGVAGCGRPGAGRGERTGRQIKGSEDFLNRIVSNQEHAPSRVSRTLTEEIQETRILKAASRDHIDTPNPACPESQIPDPAIEAGPLGLDDSDDDGSERDDGGQDDGSTGDSDSEGEDMEFLQVLGRVQGQKKGIRTGAQV